MSRLVLGWQVNDRFDPIYWTNRVRSSAGSQNLNDLFQAPLEACATHTAIIAQSGSGKSAFLGRFVEEIALRTRAKCLILDPNADFRRITDVVDETLWTAAKYDLNSQRGKLPHEASRAAFLEQWEKVNIRIRGGLRSHEANVKPIRVPWLSVSADFLAENLGPVDRTGVRNCHNFVQAIHDLLALRTIISPRDMPDYILGAERLLSQAIRSSDDFSATVREEWGLSKLPDLSSSDDVEDVKAILHIENLDRDVVHRATDQLLADALTAARSIGDTAKTFYFGKLGAYKTTGVIESNLSLPRRIAAEMPPRIDVIDLPSIDDSTRLLVVNAILQTEWEAARTSWELALQRAPDEDNRVPLLIIVDEAHNLIPHKPRNLAEAAIRDQFQTFVAEGRKYGVFVVLASQRPDKVDPIVLSECENRAVMRLSSEATVALTREALGLEDVPSDKLSACLAFPLGRALMVGPWSTQGPRVLYAAARRTVEGGRNLRKEYWTADPMGGL
jgi:hypothetical protein